jgi:hypothetical protein
MAVITLLGTDNDDHDLASGATVLSATPDASDNILCQALIYFGDGSKDLDGTGGDFELVTSIGSQTAEPSPQVVTFSTATRTAIWTAPIMVPANTVIAIAVTSPNAADSDVDVTAYLYALSSETANATVLYKLDHLVYAAESDDPADNSIIAKLAASDGDWSGYDNTTDSLEATQDEIGALNNVSSADVTTACTSSLNTYDPPTKGELDTAQAAIVTEVDANETKIDALNNISSADVTTACTSSLNTYDPPTKTEMDTMETNLTTEIDANETKIDTIDTNVDSLVASEYAVDTTVATADTTTSFTLTGGKTTADAYNGMLCLVEDADDSNIEIRRILDWTAAKVVTVDRAYSFTPASSDVVKIFGYAQEDNGIGTGPTKHTYTVTDSVTGNPVEGATVYMSISATETDPKQYMTTSDAAGKAYFWPNLASGTTVYMYSYKSGGNFTNPDTETLS